MSLYSLISVVVVGMGTVSTISTFLIFKRLKRSETRFETLVLENENSLKESLEEIKKFVDEKFQKLEEFAKTNVSKTTLKNAIENLQIEIKTLFDSLNPKVSSIDGVLDGLITQLDETFSFWVEKLEQLENTPEKLQAVETELRDLRLKIAALYKELETKRDSFRSQLSDSTAILVKELHPNDVKEQELNGFSEIDSASIVLAKRFNNEVFLKLRDKYGYNIVGAAKRTLAFVKDPDCKTVKDFLKKYPDDRDPDAPGPSGSLPGLLTSFETAFLAENQPEQTQESSSSSSGDSQGHQTAICMVLHDEIHQCQTVNMPIKGCDEIGIFTPSQETALTFSTSNAILNKNFLKWVSMEFLLTEGLNTNLYGIMKKMIKLPKSDTASITESLLSLANEPIFIVGTSFVSNALKFGFFYKSVDYLVHCFEQKKATLKTPLIVAYLSYIMYTDLKFSVTMISVRFSWKLFFEPLWQWSDLVIFNIPKNDHDKKQKETVFFVAKKGSVQDYLNSVGIDLNTILYQNDFLD